VLRAVLDRSRDRVLEVAALGVGSAIQFLGFFVPLPGRSYTVSPALLLSIITVRHLAVPFLGTRPGQDIAASLRENIEAGHLPMTGILVPIAVFSVLAIAARRGGFRSPSVWFLLGAGAMAFTGYFGAVDGGLNLIDARYGERYAYVPQALLSLSILALAATRTGWQKALAWGTAAWLIVVGGTEFFRTWDLLADGPAWRAEVAAWKADRNYALRVWSAGSEIRVTLPKRPRRSR